MLPQRFFRQGSFLASILYKGEPLVRLPLATPDSELSFHNASGGVTASSAPVAGASSAQKEPHATLLGSVNFLPSSKSEEQREVLTPDSLQKIFPIQNWPLQRVPSLQPFQSLVQLRLAATTLTPPGQNLFNHQAESCSPALCFERSSTPTNHSLPAFNTVPTHNPPHKSYHVRQDSTLGALRHNFEPTVSLNYVQSQASCEQSRPFSSSSSRGVNSTVPPGKPSSMRQQAEPNKEEATRSSGESSEPRGARMGLESVKLEDGRRANTQEGGVDGGWATWTKDEAFNLPNGISMARLISGPAIGGLIVAGHHRAALGALVIAGLSDWLDGYVAKQYNHSSTLGSYLDPLADKVLMGSVAVALAWEGTLPVWLVSLVVARDAALIGAAALHRGRTLGWKWNGWSSYFQLGTGGAPKVRPLLISKANTVFQLALVGGALTHLAYGVPASGGVNALCYLVGTTTVLSWLSYLVVYLRNPAALVYQDQDKVP